MNRCSTCGSAVLRNLNAGEWDWPYACTWCDRERLPENLRADNPWNSAKKKPGLIGRIFASLGARS